MTLLELMISMAIFSMIMISVMSTVQSMYAARIKAMNRIHLTEQLHTFGEQLFTEIKNGGTLDYEEYWNRTSFDTTTGSWHYIKASWVGNYWTGADWKNKIIEDGSFLGGYFCVSWNSNRLSVWSGCLDWASHKVTATKTPIAVSQKWKMQIYGQYARQFWDYNSNANNDNWDENKDWKIFGDEDDRNNFDWPNAFSGQIHELYLTDEIKKTRTFFRWNIIQDPAKNPAKEKDKCVINNNIPNDNCLWNIQILKLEWHDYGYNHGAILTASGAFDGQIDTWICKDWWDCEWKDFTSHKIATWKDGEWVNLFPATINVRNFKLEALPYSDPWLSAAKNDCSTSGTSCTSPFIHPYIKISLELGFSHGKRRSIKWDNPVISISTTINLDDFHINY